MTDASTYTISDWPHGLRCSACEREFVEGEPVRSVPLSIFEDGTPVEMIVCGSCELGSNTETEQP